MDARSRPAAGGFAGLILAFSAGVLLPHAAPQLPPLWSLALLAAPALWPWRGRLPYAAFVLGVLVLVLRAQAVLDARWPAVLDRSDIDATGHIAAIPERDGAHWRFLFVPDDPALPPRIRVSWYRSDAPLAANQCWNLRLRMRTPHGSMNPGGFDYEGWLFRQRIAATASVRAAERCAGDARAPLLAARQWLAQRIDSDWLPGHGAAPLIAALLIGERSGLDDHDWDVFRATGTTHLMAISGLHIGLVAGFLYFLLRWTWSLWPRLCLWCPAQRVGLLAALIGAAAYAALAGFSLPTQRALLMLLLFALASWRGRPVSSWRVLGLAWIAVLLLDPLQVVSPGLWLSFGAVAAILYLLADRRRAPSKLRSLLILQLALGVLLLPLTLYFFQGAAWSAPLVNLLAVPLFLLLLPALLAATAVAIVWPFVGVPALRALADLLLLLRHALDWAASAVPGVWIVAAPPWPALLLALLGGVLLLAPRGLPLRFSGLVLLLPLLWPPSTAPQRGYRLTALDVGQGLAVVVRTARHTLLFDAGPAYADGFDAGDSVVVPYLLHAGVPKLDLLMLSHGDNDHAGGVPAVRAAVPVARALGTPQAPPCRAGERWTWDGVDFQVLHPDSAAWSHNNRSCVLRVAWNGHVSLLTGDIERAAEQHLLNEAPAELPAELLVAPHHGSKTSSTAAFIAAVQPQRVIFAAGYGNHFGHPRADVVARYVAVGAHTHVTGVEGAISVEFDEGPRVTSWRAQGRRFWNAAP